MFNNNNYLPDLNHYRPSGQVSSAPRAPPAPEPVPAMPTVSGFGHPGNFRFLSPTQGTAVPTWVPTTGVMGVLSAPGMGASWQHSVPMTMPWANQITPHFTGQNTMSQSMPVYTMSMAVSPQTTMMQVGPKPSVRCMQLKRRHHPSATDELDGPSSKRYLSEKMASWFKGLQITPSTDESGGEGVSGASHQDGHHVVRDNGWQRFCEVEKRLEEELDDLDLDLEMSSVEERLQNGAEDEGRSNVREERGAVLRIPCEIKKGAQNPEPVLPSQIMKTITNPCMDLVLWKPPESLINSYLQPTPTSTSTSSLASSHTTSTSCNNDNSSSSVRPVNEGRSPRSTQASAFCVGTLQSSGDSAMMDSLEFYDAMDDDMDL